MRLLKYEKFFEAFLGKDKEKAIEKIILYINNGSKIDLHPYDEIYHIQKENTFLEGKLFLSAMFNRGIRINWIRDDLRNEIHSIDIWINFEFDKDPEWTLSLNGNSLLKVLPQILEFFNNPEKYAKNSNYVKIHEELSGDEDRLKELEGKLKRARTPERKKKIEEDISRCKASRAIGEKRNLDSDKIKQHDLEFDVFKAIELYTIQVAKRKSNSLIITGMAGVGKSQTVKETLKSIGLIPDVNYYFATGTVTTAGLYEVLFKNRSGLVIFDDCDAVFKDPDSVNMLKGALDTYDVREISKLTKGNTFDSTGMSDSDIQEMYDKDPKKMPNKFEFKGQIIFISNLPEDKFDDAIISRSLHVDVHLDKDQIIQRMRDIMKKISPELDMELKSEALEYLIYITENFPVKFDLNIRTLIHSINLRSGNDDEMTFGGKQEKVWKLLIKKYLVKTKKY
jgi:hypothetical protein